MATAPSPTYRVASGASINAGRFAGGRFAGGVVMGDAVLSGAVFGSTPLPAWVTSQAVGTWGTVPATNTIASLNPKNNAAINPVFPAIPEWNAGGQQSVVTAWCGATVNHTAGDFWVWGGGHTDYGGNEPYRLNLFGAAPTWQMMRPPSGATGNPITDGGFASAGHPVDSRSGLYSDGRPRPTHSYNTLVHVPGKGFTVTSLLAVFPDVNGPQLAYYFNESINDWALLSDYTGLGAANSYLGGCCYDSLRKCVWILPDGAYNMVKLDVATGASSRKGAVDNHANACQLKYDALNDLVLIYSNSSSSGWLDFSSRMSVFDPVTNMFHILPAPSGAMATGAAITSHAAGWDETARQLLFWNYQGDRTKISVLTQPSAGNPRTTAWVASELAVSGGNAVTPSVATGNGTFGRGDYVPKLGGFIVFNGVSESVYFFKVRAV